MSLVNKFYFCFFLIVLFFPFLASAEAFKFELTLPLNAPTPVFRDETIEKHLEILYLGIFDTPDPNDKTKVFSSYKYELLMKNYLGAVVGEKTVTIPRTSLRESNIDFLVYDPNLTRWVSFENVEIVVLPETTGTFSKIIISGRGQTIEPKVESFGTGAYKLGNTIHLKLVGEYLPPVAAVTLTASVNKKDRYGTITVIGDFPLLVKTDSSGKGIYEQDAAVKELFNDTNEETYFLTAAAVYLYKFKDEVAYDKSAAAKEIKQIYLGDFDLLMLSREFLNDRAYVTFNDNIEQVVSSRFLLLSEKKSSLDILYNKSFKTYPDAKDFKISLLSFDGKSYIYRITVGDDSFDASGELLGRLEVKSSSPFRRASFNGVQKEFDSEAYSLAFILNGASVPRAIFYNQNGKILHEESARDVDFSFRSEEEIDHKYFLGSRAVNLEFDPLLTDASVRWEVALKSEKKKETVKRLTVTAQVKYNPIAKTPAVSSSSSNIVDLQKRLIELLKLLINLLILQTRSGS